ncbi:unnamed protein product [Acanthoscelides obtectus]|uniref:DUF7869 domain-containing protein n=1 Tax=Acanthoscelides obtectus TaxID=200917 RepID=A0A9P0LBA5_ACAOB|nr:unnamed protein product [Acanthoscelides obtectus]CAK1678026.1 hypothetical protein AOBTE_LOCUS31725 [Acanthoscelides obtectus]
MNSTIHLKFPITTTTRVTSVQLKQSAPEERMVVQREYDQHLTESSDRYALKRQDKSNSKVNKKQKVLTVDLEKCLPTPAITNAQSFYSLKLWTFNYTIKDVSKNHTTCCVWDESVAGRGGNEMASCLLKWALVNVGKDVEEITIWSDNCPSQNRNINSVLAYFTILKQIPTLKVINHKYLLRGHTHLEVDSDHSLIERARKIMTKFQIMTPWDWQQLVRISSTSNPFEFPSEPPLKTRDVHCPLENCHRSTYAEGDGERHASWINAAMN